LSWPCPPSINTRSARRIFVIPRGCATDHASRRAWVSSSRREA
jgi:hypothetical protein